MKGYKVFNPDWTCRDFKYEVGKTYEIEEEPICCKRGFHFCEKLIDCFNYYNFDPDNKVAEVEATGDILKDGDKFCTNKITILREMTWQEVLADVNTGKGNTGRNNSGDYNSGDYNSGYRNSGYGNSGNYNSGYRNSGYGNSGNYNSGYRNSGYRNSGYGNSGNYNSGYGNSGNYNSGDYNSGDYNSGNYNSGNYNSGNYNSGYRNSGDRNVGCFNTTSPKLRFFNKDSNWDINDWLESRARRVILSCPHSAWVPYEDMTEDEKAKNKGCKTTGGFVRQATVEDKQKWWDNLSDNDKNSVKSLPNFDKAIFEEIMGVKTEG